MKVKAIFPIIIAPFSFECNIFIGTDYKFGVKHIVFFAIMLYNISNLTNEVIVRPNAFEN